MRLRKWLTPLITMGITASLFSSPRFKSVSIMELIAHPKQHEAYRVMLTGFLHLEFEGDAIYLHADDSKFRISKNGIWVNIPDELRPLAEKYNNQYVILVGTYTAKRKGHCGLFSGELNQITSIELREP